MENMKEFIDIAADPGAYARRLKDRGRLVVGYCCTYAPEEIILAAGLHPMRLFGGREDTGISDRHLQSYCCSLVRGVLAGSLSGDLDFLDGTVFPHTCDSIQRLSDIWRLNTSHGFFADVVLPVKLTTQSARQYLEDVLQKFRKELEAYFHLEITDEDLRSAIRTLNAVRSSLSEIYTLNAKNPGLLSGKELHALVKASMIMDRSELRERLEALLEELRRKAPAASGEGVRIMLVGNACNHPDIYGLIERSGARVVWDDLCTGTRSFEGMIDEQGDPIRAVAARYFDRLVCPAKHRSTTERGELLVARAREHGVQGVVFLYLKFCDPHSFDYPYLRDCFDQAGVPSMLLEIEDRLPPEGRLLTRIETFSHMIEGIGGRGAQG